MEHYELYLLALAGVSIHYLKDWVQHDKKGVKYGLRKFLPTMLLSVVTSVLVVYLREDISSLYVITPFSSVVLGYFGNSVFFSFIEAKKPKIDENEQL